MDDDPTDWDIATRLVRGGLARSPYGETAEAMFLTQSFVYASAEAADARFSGADPGFIYSRYGNPTVQMFEERLALAEGAEYCRATASGMAAVHLALSGLLRAGDHVVAGKALFGSCAWILKNWAPRYGVEVTLVDGPDTAGWRAAVRDNTKVFFLESPANPLLEICDIAAISEIARAVGAKVVVDNVFATPIYQSPLKLGADVGDQAHRRPGPGDGRGAARREGPARGGLSRSDPPHRAFDVAVQRLGPAQGPGDAGAARASPERDGGGAGRHPGRASQGHGLPLPDPRRPPAI